MIERRLKKEIAIIDIQFDFMSRRSTIEAIYLLWRVIEWYHMNQQDLYLIFIELENTYDTVPREILWQIMKNKSMRGFDLCKDIRWIGEWFFHNTRLHPRSTLNPYIFTLVFDVLMKHIQELASRYLLFVDDKFLLEEFKENLNEKLNI